MKTTTGRPTFKGTKASKDFFKKDDSKIEAPATDRPYAQVAKTGVTSGSTNTLVQASLPKMPNSSTASTPTMVQPPHARSYAIIATNAPSKQAVNFAGWNAKAKCVPPNESKTSTSAARPVTSLPQPVAPASVKHTPRIPRLFKTTAWPTKNTSPNSATPFKFVGNGSSSESSVKSYAPPSSLARPKVNAATPPAEIKPTTTTALTAGVKGAATASAKPSMSSPSAASNANVITPAIASYKNKHDSQTVVKSASAKKNDTEVQPTVKLSGSSSTMVDQKKGKNEVAPAPVLPSPRTTPVQPCSKKAELKPVVNIVDSKLYDEQVPIDKNIDSKIVDQKVDTKLVAQKIGSKFIDKEIDHAVAIAADTLVPITTYHMASSGVRADNPVIGPYMAHEQAMPSQLGPPETAATNNHTVASAVPKKKKKRNQKSGAQRKKEARNRAVPHPIVDTQVEDQVPDIPAVTVQDVDPALSVAFIDKEVLRINIQARLDALKYPLSRNVSRLESMAQSVPYIKLSQRNLEKNLRIAPTALYIRGIQMNVYDKTFELSDGYTAEHGDDLTEEDERRVGEVANHQVKAFRNVCANLEVHARAAMALEEFKSNHVASLFRTNENLPSTSDFQISMPRTSRLVNAGAPPTGEPVNFTIPPSASSFKFSMPTGSPTLGNDVSTDVQPEIKDLSFLFGNPAVVVADELGLSTELPDADTSESEDMTFHSEDPDSSATEDESHEIAPIEKKDLCWALTKYSGSLSPVDTVGILSGDPEIRLATEDELQEDMPVEKVPCLALVKYHSSLFSVTTVVMLLSNSEPHLATEDSDEPTAAVQVSQTGVAFAFADKLACVFQSCSAQLRPVKLDVDYRLPPQALQVLKLEGSYTVPPVSKLEEPPAEKTALPVENAAPSRVEYAPPPPVASIKAMVLSMKPRRVTRASSTPEQRKQRGPYRLNYLIGISPLREFLMELADPYARTYTKTELIKAFIVLSSRERDTLDIGFPHFWTAEGVLNNKRLANRIMLGSIRLSEYLDEIAFDEEGIAQKSHVLGAWQDLAAQDEAFSALEDAEANT